MEVKKLVSNLTIPHPDSHVQLVVNASQFLGVALDEFLKRRFNSVIFFRLVLVYHIDHRCVLSILTCLYVEALGRSLTLREPPMLE